jgi:hypothetical protein
MTNSGNRQSLTKFGTIVRMQNDKQQNIRKCAFLDLALSYFRDVFALLKTYKTCHSERSAAK